MRAENVRGHHLTADALPSDVPDLQSHLNIAFIDRTKTRTKKEIMAGR